MLNNIIDRLNQRIAVGNIFDKIYGLTELVESDSGKKWATYRGNGQLEHVTGFDAQQGTLFWGKRGRFNINRVDSFRTTGCQVAYDTRMLLTAYAVVRKSHLPCDSSDAADWVASRIYKLISGFDPQFKTALKVVAYEVIPSGYTSDIRSLPDNFEFAKVAVDIDVSVITKSEDSCYDICETGDIPLPDFEPCTPCLTQVAVDGETIIGNGTPEDPLVAIGGGGGAGARWFVGSGVPANTFGVNGDQYLNEVNGDVFSKISGAWSLTGNIQGPQGPQGEQGPAGTNGTNGTNGLGIVSIEKTSVSGLNDHYTITYTDGTTSEYIVKNGRDGTDGTNGTDGTDGDDGWSPILAVVSDGERRVLQVNDWTGGTGAKPTVGQYLGANGLVNNINQAVDIRGAAGQDATSNVFKSTVNGTDITGTTAQSITYAQLIPAGTFSPGQVLRFTYLAIRTAGTGNLTARILVNSTQSISGALVLALAGIANIAYTQIQNHLVIKSNTVSENPWTSSVRTTDFQSRTEAIVNLNINWAVDQWILFTVQNGANGDSSRGTFFLIEPI